jgi:hypothetical protein
MAVAVQEPSRAELPPRLRRLGVKAVRGLRFFWTPERDAALTARYGTVKNQALANDLGCTEPALRCRARDLGISRRRVQVILWNERQLDTLRRFYGVVPTAELAALLEKTPAAIRWKARDIGLEHRTNGARQALALTRERQAAADDRDATIRELRILLAAHMRPFSYLTETEAAMLLDLDEAEMHGRAVRHAATGALLLGKERA